MMNNHKDKNTNHNDMMMKNRFRFVSSLFPPPKDDNDDSSSDSDDDVEDTVHNGASTASSSKGKQRSPTTLHEKDPHYEYWSSLFGTSWSSLDQAWHNVSTLNGAAMKDSMSNASSSTWIMGVLVLWFVVQFWQLLWRKAKRRRMIRRRRKTTASLQNLSSNQQHESALVEQQRQEYDSLVAALREELQSRSCSENEQAILWRQEKNILRERIEELQVKLHNKANGIIDDEIKEQERLLLSQIEDQGAQIKFLTDLTESQQLTLDVKQREIDTLHHIMEEIQGASSTAMRTFIQHQKKKNGLTGLGFKNPKKVAATITPSKQSKSKRRSSNQEEEGMEVTPVKARLSRVEIHPANVQEELQQRLSDRSLLQQEEGEEEEKEQHDLSTEESSTTSSDNDDDDDDSTVSSDMDSTPPTPSSGKNMGPPRLENDNKIVLLVSSMPGSFQVSVHQSRLEAIFRNGLKLTDTDLQLVDGCDAALVDLRNDLFRISGLHAVYPQVFLITEGGTDIAFVGDFDTIVDLHDKHELPERIGALPVSTLSPFKMSEHKGTDQDDDEDLDTQEDSGPGNRHDSGTVRPGDFSESSTLTASGGAAKQQGTATKSKPPSLVLEDAVAIETVNSIPSPE